MPTIPGVEKPALNLEEAREYANVCGYPVILKAAAGGGGRGMRVVNREEDLENEYLSACNEAKKLLGLGMFSLRNSSPNRSTLKCRY